MAEFLLIGFLALVVGAIYTAVWVIVDVASWLYRRRYADTLARLRAERDRGAVGRYVPWLGFAFLVVAILRWLFGSGVLK